MWHTVEGGSREYVRRVVDAIGDVRQSAGVTKVVRSDDAVKVTTTQGTETFDIAVIATHADDALAILGDATADEKRDLAAIGYSNNPTWLHRDSAVLPATSKAWGSWNFRKDECGTSASSVLISYWMNRLHAIEAPDDFIVTLNPEGRVDPDSTIARMVYRHPIFTPEAVKAAARLRSAGGPRLAFAGAHLGWGFHEDGCLSGVDAAKRLGGSW